MRRGNQRSYCADNRRELSDRRRLTGRTFFYSIFSGRRRGPQRYDEKNRFYYTDVYDARLLLVVLLIVALSAADAGLTLLILEKGGVELNPLMDWALAYSNQTFFIIKYLLTAIGIFIVVVHVNFRIFKLISMPKFLVGLLTFYVLLIGYEFSILAA